jgi:hypothetical protein
MQDKILAAEAHGDLYFESILVGILDIRIRF